MLLILGLLSQQAYASTFYLSDVGIRGFSRGGAFIAGANDISAHWYNPGAFTRMRGGSVTLHTAGVHQFTSFDRAEIAGGTLDANGQAITNPEVSNQAVPMAIPHIGITHDFGIKNATFYLGLTTPYASDFSYPEDGPQRYSLIDAMVIQTFAGPGFAYRFLDDWVSVGATASWSTLKLEQSRKAVMYGNAIKEDSPMEYEYPYYDIAFAFAGEDLSAFTWNVGFLIEPPNKKWSLGFSVQPPTSYQLEGSLDIDFSENRTYKDWSSTETDKSSLQLIHQETAQDKDVSIAVVMPMILRGGFLIRPKKHIELEIAGVWEGWSSVGKENLILEGLNLSIQTAGDEPAVLNDPLEFPTGYVNSWSVRLGGEYADPSRRKRYAFRSGVIFEKSGVPAEYTSLSLLDQDKFGYGLGATYTPTPAFSVDVGWFQSFLGNWTTDNSKVYRTGVIIDTKTAQETGDFMNPPVYIDSEERIVGNGDYWSSAMIFGAGLTYRWGKYPNRFKGKKGKKGK